MSLDGSLQGLRLGAVSYLNSKPLIEGLAAAAREQGAQLVLDYPSRLAEGLARGAFDVALVPSIEVCQHADYEIVSDACVATHGPVLSVKMYSRCPLRQIRTLALDEGSRTSAALTQILLKEYYNVSPQPEPLPLEQSLGDTTADAVLLIGDRAMFTPQEEFAVTWDLGEEWRRHTRLPFVFAVWAARKGSPGTLLSELLSQARDQGVQSLEEIARREGALLGLKPQTTIPYLQNNLYFYLGLAEQRGLELYRELAVRHGFCPEREHLVFRDCATAR